MAGVIDNKLLIGGAIVIIFLGLLVAFQRVQTPVEDMKEISYPARTVIQKLSTGTEVGGYPFVFNYRLAARCTRLFFDFNETQPFHTDICPKDLSAEEQEELSRFTPYPLRVEGRDFYYNSNLFDFLPPTGEDTGSESLAELRFLSELISIVEG